MTCRKLIAFELLLNDMPKINNIFRRKTGHTHISHFGLPSTVKKQSKRKYKKSGEKWSNRHANATKIQDGRTIHRRIQITKTCSNHRVTAFCKRSIKSILNKH